MSKQNLTPFDWDLVAMIEHITGEKTNVVTTDSNYHIYWDLDPSISNYDKIHMATSNAITGRLGERYISTVEGKTNITTVKYDPSSWDEELRFDLRKPDVNFGGEYIRKVNAVNFDLNLINYFLEFVGGGTLTKFKDGSGAKFEFPNQDGMNTTVKLGEYVIYENGCFSVMSGKEFEKLYTRER